MILKAFPVKYRAPNSAWAYLFICRFSLTILVKMLYLVKFLICRKTLIVLAPPCFFFLANPETKTLKSEKFVFWSFLEVILDQIQIINKLID